MQQMLFYASQLPFRTTLSRSSFSNTVETDQELMLWSCWHRPRLWSANNFTVLASAAEGGWPVFSSRSHLSTDGSSTHCVAEFFLVKAVEQNFGWKLNPEIRVDKSSVTLRARPLRIEDLGTRGKRHECKTQEANCMESYVCVELTSGFTEL